MGKRFGDICPECGHDSEEQARLVVHNRELTKQRDRALAEKAIAQANLELVNLSDKKAYSRAQSKIARQRAELKRMDELMRSRMDRRGTKTKPLMAAPHSFDSDWLSKQDHVHLEGTNECIKNRYGPKCGGE